MLHDWCRHRGALQIEGHSCCAYLLGDPHEHDAGVLQSQGCRESPLLQQGPYGAHVPIPHHDFSWVSQVTATCHCMTSDSLLCTPFCCALVGLHGCLSDLPSCRDLKDDDDTERLFDLLMETVPHLDKPTLFLKEKGTTAQNSADASTKGAAPAGLRNPADIIQVRGRPAGMNYGGTLSPLGKRLSRALTAVSCTLMECSC